MYKIKKENSSFYLSFSGSFSTCFYHYQLLTAQCSYIKLYHVFVIYNYNNINVLSLLIVFNSDR